MEPEVYDAVCELEDEHWWFVGRRAVIRQLIARVGRYVSGYALRASCAGCERPLRVLDVGCGTGGTTQFLGRYGSVTGVDLVLAALRSTLRRGVIELAQADAERLPFADSTFDIVCMLDVLEHLEDDLTSLAEAIRVCRSQGTILLFVPAFSILWSAEDIVSHHRRRYTYHSLRARVERARDVRGGGLCVRHMSYVNVALFLPVLLFAKLYTWLDRKRRPQTNLRHMPALVNRLLASYSSLEASLVTRIPLPFGTSLICLATKE